MKSGDQVDPPSLLTRYWYLVMGLLPVSVGGVQISVTSPRSFPRDRVSGALGARLLGKMALRSVSLVLPSSVKVTRIRNCRTSSPETSV